MRIVLLLAVITATLVVDHARACNDIVNHNSVIGVLPDGGWVEFDHGGGTGPDYHLQPLRHFGADGALVAEAVFCSGSCDAVCTDGPDTLVCRNRERLVPFVGAGVVVPDITAEGFEATLFAAVVASLKLAPLKASATKLVVQRFAEDDAVCASIGVKRGQPLMTIGPYDVACTKSKVSLYESDNEAARFEFVQVRASEGAGGCSTTRDTMTAVPKARRAAMAAFVAAGRLARSKRIPIYRATVEAEPGYVPARIALYRALYDAKVPWPEAKRTMDVPWPAELWGGLAITYGEALELGDDHAWAGRDYDAWVASLPAPNP